MAIAGKKVGLTDVARKAKVSLGTASRVLNGHPAVSAHARQAVEDAILELGYQLNPAARSLPRSNADGTSWTGNIALFLPGTSEKMLYSPFVSGLAALLQQELAGTGCHLVIATSLAPESIPNILLERKVDGVVIHGSISRTLCAKVTGMVPTVGVCGHYFDLPPTAIDVDTMQAMRLGVDYLRELGHRRIGFVGRHGVHHGFSTRLAGYRNAMAQAALPVWPGYEVCTAVPARDIQNPEERPPELELELRRLFEQPEPPTALLVCNDWTAIGVYRALKQLGLRVPEEVAVIGFDNDLRICEALEPRLTSLSMPLESIGRQSIKALLEYVKHGASDLAGTIFCASSLVTRDSCGPRRPE